MGAMLLASTGVFFPLPVTSIMISLMPGGRGEFIDGLKVPFTGSYRGNLDQPPRVEEFRVRRG